MISANHITLIRIAMIPFFMFFAYKGDPKSMFIALIIFIIASATDALDGYIARKYNQITDFGKFIDPLADKLLVLSALLIFVENGQMPSVFCFIILAREFIITSMRTVIMGKGKVLAASMSGKIKTVVQILGICIMFTNFAYISIGTFPIIGSVDINDIAVWSITLVTIWSGMDYLKANWAFIKDGI